MKNKLIWTVVCTAVVLSMLLVSCGKSTTTGSTSTTTTQIVTPQSTTQLTAQTKTSNPVSTSAPGPTTTAAPTASHWWDQWGTPQYGGELNTVYNSPGAPQFDNYSFIGANYQLWLETPWSPVDPVVDRNEWSYLMGFTPEKYCTGNLIESWEIPDAQTIIAHVRQGVTWQNKAPVNGRELTAYDIQAHYDRLMGTGDGYTSPAPMYRGMSPPYFKNAVAKDKYTVVFNFSQPTGSGLIGLVDPFGFNTIEAPEWVAQGDLQNWKNAVGSGAWMLTDYISGSSMVFSKNPEYWAKDSRYPQNKLPYADQLNVITIPDVSTKLAALRTGQIDTLSNVDWQQASSLKKTNSDLLQAANASGATGVGLRNDKAPFTDIKVRKALQLALDLPAIAKGYYGGTSENTPCGLVSPALKGYAYAYADWPQSLKDEYSYNIGQARKLMMEAGFPNGFETNIVASPMNDIGLLQVIKAQFQDIGVNMEIKMMDVGVQRAYINEGKHDQMVAWGGAMIQGSMPPILARFDSTNLSLNWCHVNDPGYDAIVAKFSKATTADEIAKIMVEADKYTIEQHYVVNTVATNTYTFWRPDLKGYAGEAWLGWGSAYMFARMWKAAK